MRHHGVPEQVVAADEPFWDFLRDGAEPFARRPAGWPTATRSAPAGRALRVVARPGHSTTDTLFVDDRDALAFTGDHLLSRISSNTEISSPDRPGRRPRALAPPLPREPAPHRGMPLAAAC